MAALGHHRPQNIRVGVRKIAPKIPFQLLKTITKHGIDFVRIQPHKGLIDQLFHVDH